MALKLFPTVWLVAVLIVVVHAQQQAKPNKGEDKRSFVTGIQIFFFSMQIFQECIILKYS